MSKSRPFALLLAAVLATCLSTRVLAVSGFGVVPGVTIDADRVVGGEVSILAGSPCLSHGAENNCMMYGVVLGRPDAKNKALSYGEIEAVRNFNVFVMSFGAGGRFQDEDFVGYQATLTTGFGAPLVYLRAHTTKQEDTPTEDTDGGDPAESSESGEDDTGKLSVHVEVGLMVKLPIPLFWW